MQDNSRKGCSLKGLGDEHLDLGKRQSPDFSDEDQKHRSETYETILESKSHILTSLRFHIYSSVKLEMKQ